MQWCMLKYIMFPLQQSEAMETKFNGMMEE